MLNPLKAAASMSVMDSSSNRQWPLSWPGRSIRVGWHGGQRSENDGRYSDVADTEGWAHQLKLADWFEWRSLGQVQNMKVIRETGTGDLLAQPGHYVECSEQAC